MHPRQRTVRAAQQPLNSPTPAKSLLMSDTQPAALSTAPPDRLCTSPNSKFYDEALLTRGVGIRFKGVEKNNVEEYCISEGWVRLVAGTARDRAGNPMTVKLKGDVQAYFRDIAQTA
jgi:hypothetical protein